MSQVLGAFGLLDFTMLRPFSLGALFETYETFIASFFNFFSGRVESRITETAEIGLADTGYNCNVYQPVR
jgi:hypothetical protein